MLDLLLWGVFAAGALAAVLAVVWLLRRAAGGSGAPGTPERGVYRRYASPDFSDRAGFRLTAYPSNELLLPRQFWLVSGTIGVARYTVVPAQEVYLLTAAEGGDLPDELTSETPEEEGRTTVDGTAVQYRASAGGETVMRWNADGFDYALYAKEPEMNTVGGILPDFIRGTAAAQS